MRMLHFLLLLSYLNVSFLLTLHIQENEYYLECHLKAKTSYQNFCSPKNQFCKCYYINKVLEKCLGFCSAYNNNTVEQLLNAFCKSTKDDPSEYSSVRYDNSFNHTYSTAFLNDISLTEPSDQLLLALERNNPLQDGRMKYRGPYIHSGYPKDQALPKLPTSLPFGFGYQSSGTKLSYTVSYMLISFIFLI